MMKCYFVYFLLFLCCGVQGSLVPDAYEGVTVLPLKMWGWFGDGNKKKLPELIRKSKAKIIVELGSFLGESTAFIASHSGVGAKIYAVDIWKDTPECKGAMRDRGMGEAEIALFFSRLYNQFLSNMIHRGIAQQVIPVRMTTLEAAQQLIISPDLIYVDASHTTEDAYNDIMHWYPKLVVGGIMCGDDWSWPTVRKAVEICAEELNQIVGVCDNFWWFQPKQ